MGSAVIQLIDLVSFIKKTQVEPTIMYPAAHSQPKDSPILPRYICCKAWYRRCGFGKSNTRSIADHSTPNFGWYIEFSRQGCEQVAMEMYRVGNGGMCPKTLLGSRIYLSQREKPALNAETVSTFRTRVPSNTPGMISFYIREKHNITSLLS